MAASGVCRSDSHAVNGVHRHAMPIVLGHEGSAVVEEVGEGVHRGEARRPRRLLVATVLRLVPPVFRGTAGRVRTARRLQRVGFLADGTTRVSLGETQIHHNVPSSFAERSVVPSNTVPSPWTRRCRSNRSRSSAARS